MTNQVLLAVFQAALLFYLTYRLMKKRFKAVSAHVEQRFQYLKQECDWRLGNFDDRIKDLADPSIKIAEWDKKTQIREGFWMKRLGELQIEIERIQDTPAYQDHQEHLEALESMDGGDDE